MRDLKSAAQIAGVIEKDMLWMKYKLGERCAMAPVQACMVWGGRGTCSDSNFAPRSWWDPAAALCISPVLNGDQIPLGWKHQAGVAF